MNGEPSVVVMDVGSWLEKRGRLDHAETIAGVQKGLVQARAGEGIDAARFFDERSFE